MSCYEMIMLQNAELFIGKEMGCYEILMLQNAEIFIGKGMRCFERDPCFKMLKRNVNVMRHREIFMSQNAEKECECYERETHASKC